MGKLNQSSTFALRSWRDVIIFIVAIVLVNWLVGASGYFLYQTYRSSTSQPEQALNDGAGDARYWAERVSSADGAFILYFRHAEREKWPLVAVYDYFEVHQSIDGSRQSFAAGVCLSERGKEDARLIGQVFDTADIPIASVLSSPSCRSKETARLAFGRIDVTDKAILSGGAVGVRSDPESANNLLDVLVRNSPEVGEIVVVVGHSHTLETKAEELFPDLKYAVPALDESGFYVLELVDGRIIPRWAFVDFTDFAHEVLTY